ncbi:MAG: hypothetical protein IPI77_25105 [Saprospiraceae bacterium]|nr:hypothetical protein [Saprospiraceae bacterium]
MAKFPVNINNCGFKSQDAAARLTFGLSVNLVPEKENSIWVEYSDHDHRQHGSILANPSMEGVSINSIGCAGVK